MEQVREPDVDRWLTDEELAEAIRKDTALGFPYPSYAQTIRKAQDAKTHTIDLAHEHARIDNLIRRLKILWGGYEENTYLGISRHTFTLPKDWEGFIRGELAK